VSYTTIVRRLFWVAIALLGVSRTFHAQEMEVPIEVQFPLLLKVLAFDRSLKTRVGEEIVIGIVYQEKFRASLNVKDEVEALAGMISPRTIQDVPFRTVAIDLASPRFRDILADQGVDILYVAPLRAVGVEEIAAISRERRLTTLSGVPDYVEKSLAVGVGIKGEKPMILINLPAARAEGANFSSQLLKLAKVIE